MIHIQQDIYDFTQQKDKKLSNISELNGDSNKLNKFIGTIKEFLIRKLNKLISLPLTEITI
jgi:hypothetical protein